MTPFFFLYVLLCTEGARALNCLYLKTIALFKAIMCATGGS